MLLLSWVLKPFTLLLTGLDRLLIYLATPFGVHVTDPRKRFAILLGHRSDRAYLHEETASPHTKSPGRGGGA